MEAERTTDTFVDADGADVSVSYNSSDESVVERYCGHCESWVEVRGVTGALRWLSSHEKGDCGDG